MRVLFVCTGNVCRSPAASAIFESSPMGRLSLTIKSAGTAAVDGEPVHPHTAEALRSISVSPPTARSRRLSATALRDAEVVIAMARDHRAAVVKLSPRHVRFTFTLRELARIAARISDPAVLGAAPRQRWERLLAHAPTLRVPPADPADDDVPDPIGGPGEQHQQAVGMIVEAVAALSRVTIGDQRYTAVPDSQG